ncbi:MAG: PKD domain-containing protein [Dehalococcoidia bacterium]
MALIKNTVIVAVLIAAVAAALFAAASCSAPAPTQQTNRPPVIQQISGLTDWSPQSEGQLTCVASDEDGDLLEYKWVAENGTITGQGPTVTWMTPAARGKYKITVTVSDGKGGQATAVHEANVIINADGSASADAPVVLKMSLPSGEVITGAKRMRIWTATPIECIVDSADTKNLKFKWSANSGKLQAASGMSLNDGTASKVNWIAPGVGGEFKVNVIVTDASGNEAKGTVNFDVFCCSTE